MGPHAELPPPGKVAAPIGRPFPRFLFARSARFRYISVGSMASMGLGGGVVDMTKADVLPAWLPARAAHKYKGFVAFLTWRMGYLSKQLSLKNAFLVPMFWLKSAVFGRDVSRF